jgi:hypothetical protein
MGLRTTTRKAFMTTYPLTEQERSGLQGLANQVSAAKLAVYDANVEAEKLKEKLSTVLRDVDAANAAFRGGVSFLLSAHGFASGQLAPDLSHFTNVTPKD